MRLGLLALALVGVLWLADHGAGVRTGTTVARAWLQADEAEGLFVAATLDAPASLESASLVPPADPLEMDLLELTNRERAIQGLAPVEFDPELLEIARARAAAQLGQAPLSHYDEGGTLVFSALLDGAGLPYRLAGENLARLPGPEVTAPERAQRALLNSPTHRENILESRFNRLAVGVAERDGRIVFAEIFRAY